MVNYMQVKEMMTKKVITCEENEPVSQALGKMRENNIHQLLVMKGKELKGLIFLNDIVKKEADLSSIKVSNLTKSIPSIASNKTLEEAIEIILKSNSRALPVIDKDIVGIISETDIMKNVDIEFDVEALAKKCFFVEDTDKIGKVRNLISQKNGFLDITTSRDKDDQECINIIVKFNNSENLYAWANNDLHQEVINNLGPYRTKGQRWFVGDGIVLPPLDVQEWQTL